MFIKLFSVAVVFTFGFSGVLVYQLYKWWFTVWSIVKREVRVHIIIAIVRKPMIRFG